jgi:Holliday junction DNA helicase RuvA
MIGRLTGTVADEQPNGSLVIDVAGVGYQVLAPAGTVSKLSRNQKGESVVFVHTHVRAEALDLYGFSHESEREVFRLLINVPNVGPRTALNVLGALPVPELISAVSGGDVKRLNRVPGIGKKTAERLVLELKEKLLSVQPGDTALMPGQEGNRARLVTALTNMGYRPTEAERAVKGLGERVDNESLSTLLREALQALSG